MSIRCNIGMLMFAESNIIHRSKVAYRLLERHDWFEALSGNLTTLFSTNNEGLKNGIRDAIVKVFKVEFFIYIGESHLFHLNRVLVHCDPETLDLLPCLLEAPITLDGLLFLDIITELIPLACKPPPKLFLQAGRGCHRNTAPIESCHLRIDPLRARLHSLTLRPSAAPT